MENLVQASGENQHRMHWLVPTILVAAAIVASPWDVALARFFMSDPLPGELRSLIHKSEFFGHAYGILGIVFTIYLVNEHRRRELARILATALLAGVLCDLVKTIVHRVRPVDFSFAAGETTYRGLSFLHVDSFSQIFDSAFHSFPSAHTATAVSFAMALGAMYPGARRWFLVLAALVATSRFDGGAHYVSDTLIGAAIGHAAGCWMLGPSRISHHFSEYERGRRPLWPKLGSRGGVAANRPPCAAAPIWQEGK